MPDEDKNFGCSLVSDFRKRWFHVKTIYTNFNVISAMQIKLGTPPDTYINA